jgi:flagellar motor switch protein FliM
MTDVPFDFRSPHAAEATTIISDWLGRACKSAAKQWPKQWSIPVDVSFGGIRTARPLDLLKSVPETSLGCALAVRAAQDSPAFLTFDRPLLLALLAGLLGEPVSAMPDDRELTQIELSMVEVLIEQILSPIRLAWLGENEPKLAIVSTGIPRAACRLPADVPAIVVDISVKAPFGDGKFTLALPTAGWSHPKAALNDRSAPTSFPRALAESAVRELGVDFSVLLGHARLTLKELTNLKPGDVLVLEQRVTDPLRARIGGKERFQVWPGALGRRQAVRIHAASQPSKS